MWWKMMRWWWRRGNSTSVGKFRSFPQHSEARGRLWSVFIRWEWVCDMLLCARFHSDQCIISLSQGKKTLKYWVFGSPPLCWFSPNLVTKGEPVVYSCAKFGENKSDFIPISATSSLGGQKTQNGPVSDHMIIWCLGMPLSILPAFQQ